MKKSGKKTSDRLVALKIIALVVAGGLLYYLLMSAMFIGGCAVFMKINNTKGKDYVYEDFVCHKNYHEETSGRRETRNYYICVANLSPVGRRKKTVVIPSTIDGYSVEVGSENLFKSDSYYWKTNELEKVYVSPEVKIEKWDFLRYTATEKLINNARENLAASDALSLDGIDVYNIYGASFERVNVCFYLNYYKEEAEDRYWIDVLCDEKISVEPPEPQRDSYAFAGWFKEPECVTPWKFDSDIVRAPIYRTVKIKGDGGSGNAHSGSTKPTFQSSYGGDERNTKTVCDNRVNLYAKWVKAE